MRPLSTPWANLLIGSFAVACVGDPGTSDKPEANNADSGSSETGTPDSDEDPGGEGTGQTGETGQSDNGGDDDYGGECGDKGGMSGTFAFGVEGRCLSTMFVAGSTSADPCPGCDFAFDVMYSEDFDECGFNGYWDIRTGSGNYAGYFDYAGTYYDAQFVYYDGYGWYPSAISQFDGSVWVYYNSFVSESSGYTYYNYGYVNVYAY